MSMNDKKKGVQVIIEDLDEHPKCSHGPTILFSTHLGQRYFSCSCYRDLKFCPFKVNLEDYLANPKKYQALYHPINHYLSYEEVGICYII